MRITTSKFLLKLLTVIMSFASITSYGQTSQKMNFEHDGIELSGIVNIPETSTSKGLVIIIHGDGRTDAVDGNWWYDVRQAINQASFTTFMWDKPGCGSSKGIYEQNRAIESEASEVISAIKYLKAEKINGHQNIGLWGISRAGWINPVVISQYDEIDFWMSVSGVTAHETFKYLLENNLRIEGYDDNEVELLINQWHQGLLMTKNGSNYEDYLKATADLQKNAFWLEITDGGITEKEFKDYRMVLQKMTLDEETQLPIYVENFKKKLEQIEVPVLAVFGKTDMTVDWKATQELYKNTLSDKETYEEMTIDDCNHNMWTAKTGGIYESENPDWKYSRCPGFLEGMKNWLENLELNRKN